MRQNLYGCIPVAPNPFSEGLYAILATGIIPLAKGYCCIICKHYVYGCIPVAPIYPVSKGLYDPLAKGFCCIIPTQNLHGYIPVVPNRFSQALYVILATGLIPLAKGFCCMICKQIYMAVFQLPLSC